MEVTVMVIIVIIVFADCRRRGRKSKMHSLTIACVSYRDVIRTFGARRARALTSHVTHHSFVLRET